VAGGGLSGSNVFVLGVVDAPGRALAVALAEAGGTVSVTTATLAESEQFFVNSVLNEVWAMGRAGAAFITDGAELEEIRSAVEIAGGPSLVAMPAVSELAWPGHLASEAGSVLVSIRHSNSGFTVRWGDTGQASEVAANELGAAVVDLLAGIKD
jgi:NAD(P)-dependent dehydrogenase (short-subunit alcohol dehydrogenase family)